MILNAEQQAALSALTKHIRNGGMMTLTGFAGTGKTTVLSQLRARRIAFTAPTHKAVAVLESSGVPGDTMTIHRMLGLKMQTRNGIDSMVKGGRNHMRYYDAIVIDECSMIGRELYDMIANDADYHGAPIIFSGDALQLPPVGERDSPTFDFIGAELNQNMRQDASSAVSRYVSELRAALKHGGHVPMPQNAPGLHITNNEKQFEHWIQSNQKRWENGETRVIAWRNATVERYGKMIQKSVNPGHVTPFVLGEAVYFKKYYEFNMLRIYPQHHDVVRNIRHNGDEWLVNLGIGTVPITGPKAAHLLPATVITAHQSQGSTYAHAFIDVRDILCNPNKREAVQCLYVAISRARGAIACLI